MGNCRCNNSFSFNGDILIVGFLKMKIASVSENKKIERRIAITPEIAKKYISLGFEIILSENYGDHLGIKDNF